MNMEEYYTKEENKMKQIDKHNSENLKDRISEEIENLNGSLEEFSKFKIPNFEEYKKNLMMKAVFERYFEKIIESIISLTFFIIRIKKLNSPESEEHAFSILSKNNIIDENLAKRLKEAKNMRNRIIPNYITIDDSIVYYSVTEEIIRDAEDFIKSINESLI